MDELADNAPVYPSLVLITGYSQGSLIAPAVAQLPSQRIDNGALLTLARTFRRLYGRAFPAYFSYEYAVEHNELLMNGRGPESDGKQVTRNRKMVKYRSARRLYSILNFLLTEAPGQPLHPDSIDVACFDPPSPCQKPGGSLGPIHNYSDWWKDSHPRLYAGRLITQLETVFPTRAATNVEPASQNDQVRPFQNDSVRRNPPAGTPLPPQRREKTGFHRIARLLAKTAFFKGSKNGK